MSDEPIAVSGTGPSREAQDRVKVLVSEVIDLLLPGDEAIDAGDLAIALTMLLAPIQEQLGKRNCVGGCDEKWRFRIEILHGETPMCTMETTGN